jgi:hypothetical protein
MRIRGRTDPASVLSRMCVIVPAQLGLHSRTLVHTSHPPLRASSDDAWLRSQRVVSDLRIERSRKDLRARACHHHREPSGRNMAERLCAWIDEERALVRSGAHPLQGWADDWDWSWLPQGDIPAHSHSRQSCRQNDVRTVRLTTMRAHEYRDLELDDLESVRARRPYFPRVTRQ